MKYKQKVSFGNIGLTPGTINIPKQGRLLRKMRLEKQK